MRKNYVIEILRLVIPVHRKRNAENGRDDSEKPYYDEQIGEDLKIQVDDKIPDFLKTQDEIELLQSTEVQKENDKIVSEERGIVEPTSESLLDNKPLVKMFEECAGIIKNLERIRLAFESDDCQDLINTVREQLVQAMILSGGKTIDNEKHFNILRHKCVKGIRANDGDEIAKTIEPGVLLEDRVFVKALVEIKTDKEK